MKEIIRVENMTKDYGNHKGIFDVNISVREGEIYGFLGPNGAGKSTTIRHLLGFARPDKGKCSILGMDCFREAAEIQKSLGYLAGEIAFMNDMTGKQLLQFIAEMKRVPEQRRIRNLMERFELDPSGKVRKMSKGMKQKIGIIAAFMAEPKVIILDEPTSGLDPLMQNRFVELLLEERKKGNTILMSSHIFEEIEKTCDRTAIIRQGEIVSVEDMETLAGKKQKQYEVSFTEENALNSFVKAYKEKTKKPAEIENGKVIFSEIQPINEMLAMLSNYPIKNLEIRKQSLEEIFMHFYGEV